MMEWLLSDNLSDFWLAIKATANIVTSIACITVGLELLALTIHHRRGIPARSVISAAGLGLLLGAFTRLLRAWISWSEAPIVILIGDVCLAILWSYVAIMLTGFFPELWNSMVPKKVMRILQLAIEGQQALQHRLDAKEAEKRGDE